MAFYRDVLGLDAAFRSPDCKAPRVRCADIDLILHTDTGMPLKNWLPVAAIVIPEFDTADDDGCYSVLLSRGGQVSGQPRDMPFGLQQLYVNDPMVTRSAFPPREASAAVIESGRAWA